MKKGSLIVFEGIDGAGKATQVKLVAAKLRKQGHTVTVFSFPDYSRPVGQFIHDSLHNKFGNHRAVDAYHASFLYAVDRALAREKIVAALKKGIVICDRYTTSTLAFGAANCAPKDRAKFQAFFEKFEFDDFKLPRPTRVIYLALPVALTRSRIAQRGKKLDANERDVSYQKAVAAEYAKLAKRKEWRTVVCKEGETPNAVAERVEDALA